MEVLQISLAAARVNAGLTQKEAAERLGVSNTTIVAWETGKSSPSIVDAKKLSEAYNIPLDNIFFPQTVK